MLDGVTGEILHGRVTAVMGPSGAGKVPESPCPLDQPLIRFDFRADFHVNSHADYFPDDAVRQGDVR